MLLSTQKSQLRHVQKINTADDCGKINITESISVISIQLHYIPSYQKDIIKNKYGIKIDGFGKKLPDFIYKQATSREKIDKLKTIAGLWTDQTGKTYYSLLVPVGGFRVVGYMEVIINPVFNLINLSKELNKPFKIFDSNKLSNLFYSTD